MTRINQACGYILALTAHCILSTSCGSTTNDDFTSNARTTVFSTHFDSKSNALPPSHDVLSWKEHQHVSAFDAAAYERFGAAVAVDGDTALVGIPADRVGVYDQRGSVHVFTRIGTTWQFTFRLVAADGMSYDKFGTAVALSGDTAFIGAPGRDLTRGAVYAFARATNQWIYRQTLTASDKAQGDGFGTSMALDGDTLVVGTPSANIAMNDEQGAAYAFTRVGDVWTEQQKLFVPNGSRGDEFGTSVAISGETIVVGAPCIFTTVLNPGPGAAHAFTRNNGTWTLEQTLTPSNGVAKNHFGTSVVVAGNTAVVSSPGSVFGMNYFQGSAYVYGRIGNTWTEVQQVSSSNGQWNDRFGSALAFSGTTLLAGSAGTGANPSAVYAFELVGGMFAERQKVTPLSRTLDDFFGAAIGLSGTTAIVGAPGIDIAAAEDIGGAYIFNFHDLGDACGTSSDCAQGFCVDGVCCDNACGNGNTMDCQACSITAGATKNGTCSIVTAGMECRSAAHSCDVADVCDGLSSECPSDIHVPDGTPCPNGLCSNGLCVEMGAGGNGGSGTSSSTSSGGGTGGTDNTSSSGGGAGEGGAIGNAGGNASATSGGTGGGGAAGGSTDNPQNHSCTCLVVGHAPDDTPIGFAASIALSIVLLFRNRRPAVRGLSTMNH